VSHSHSHASTLPADPPRRTLARVLAAVVGLIALVTVVAMVLLWPSDDEVPHAQDPYAAEGVSRVAAVVTDVRPFDCNADGLGPDQTQAVAGDCAEVTADAGGEKATFTLDPTRWASGMRTGDEIQVLRIAPPGQPTTWEFYDFERGLPLAAIAVVFGLLVVAVARWRGLFAIAGIGVTLVVLLSFVMPALLAGGHPLLVAVVGSTAIMILVLYLAHGVSIRTTSALFGTLVGLALTAVLGAWATDWSNLTGIASDDDRLLAAVATGADLSGIVAASMVIAGLGVLNDVTVTQASAVWEMRALQPGASRTRLFTSAMRIGRDHIASSVYTLVFAYAGSAMTVLLLVSAYSQSLTQVATSEEIGSEVARTLVGAIGLVLAVPITTAFAALLAPRGEDVPEPGPDAVTA
jgi:uncharacterized membrane protein